jgi:hypothetical protein
VPGLATRCLAALVPLAALAACGGGDADDCAPGNVRASGGHACAVAPAAFVVDGDPSEWDDVPVIAVAPACRVDSCAGLAPEALQLARGHDAVGRDALAFHVRLAGGMAPPPGSDVDLVIELRDTLAYPTGTVDRLIFGPGHEPRYLRNDFVVAPPLGLALPFELELTADGFEGSLATAGLPFPFGARLSIYATTTDPGSSFRRDVVDSVPLVRACWAEAEGTTDPCAGAGAP